LNPFSYEAELMALAVGLYIYDGFVLLFANEALLICDAKGRWRVSFGWIGFTISGRSPAPLNFFTVGRPAFRLQWHFDRVEGDPSVAPWEGVAKQLVRFKWWALGSWSGLFICLPVGMFTAVGAPAIWVAVVLIYGSALIAVIHLWVRRRALGLSGMSYAGMAIECLLCPPFAANLVRRVGLKCRVAESLPHAAARLLQGRQRIAARAACESRLDREIATASGADVQALQARKAEVSRWLEAP
jgi:hypothetical protein